jgi:thiaminase
MMHQGVVNELLEKYKMTKEQLDAISRGPSLYNLDSNIKSINGSFEEMVVNLLPAHILFGEIYVRTAAAGKDPRMTAELANMFVSFAEWLAGRLDARAASFDAAKLKKLDNIFKTVLNLEFLIMESMWNQEEYYLKNLPVQ